MIIIFCVKTPAASSAPMALSGPAGGGPASRVRRGDQLAAAAAAAVGKRLFHGLSGCGLRDLPGELRVVRAVLVRAAKRMDLSRYVPAERL